MSSPDLYPDSREGVQGVEPFPELPSTSEENLIDHHLEEFREHIVRARAMRRVSTESEIGTESEAAALEVE